MGWYVLRAHGEIQQIAPEIVFLLSIPGQDFPSPACVAVKSLFGIWKELVFHFLE